MKKLLLAAIVFGLVIVALSLVPPEDQNQVVLAEDPTATPTETPNPGPTPAGCWSGPSWVWGVWTMPGEPRQVMNLVRVSACNCGRDEPPWDTCEIGGVNCYCDQLGTTSCGDPDWDYDLGHIIPNIHNCGRFDIADVGMLSPPVAAATPDYDYNSEEHPVGDWTTSIWDDGGEGWYAVMRYCDTRYLEPQTGCYDYDPRYHTDVWRDWCDPMPSNGDLLDDPYTCGGAGEAGWHIQEDFGGHAGGYALVIFEDAPQ